MAPRKTKVDRPAATLRPASLSIDRDRNPTPNPEPMPKPKPAGITKPTPPQHGRLTRKTSEVAQHKFLQLVDGPKYFPAFEVPEEYKARNGRTYVKKVVVSPESGIHSQAWAESIILQPGLNSLPPEIRKRIIRSVYLLSWTYQLNPLYHRAQGKFLEERTYRSGLSVDAILLIKSYKAMSLVCRQFYVDVVGSGDLYRFAAFVFCDHFRLNKYIKSINPFHVSCIKSVTLNLRFEYERADATFRQPIEKLGKLKSLQALKLHINYYGSFSGKYDIFTEAEEWGSLNGKLKVCEIDVHISFFYRRGLHEEMEKKKEIEGKIKEILLAK